MTALVLWVLAGAVVVTVAVPLLDRLIHSADDALEVES